MSLQRVAEEYFSKMNSMAGRLHADMHETKLAYEDLWNKLSHEEQQQILSESIIKPEICLRYNSGEPESVEEKYAVKVVVDDNGSYYRDEHSAPFSFKTSSQRDLTVFNKDSKEKPVAAPKSRKVAWGFAFEHNINLVILLGD